MIARVVALLALSLLIASFRGAAPESGARPALVSDDGGSVAPGAPQSGRVERGSFYSNVLARTLPYIVYLPPGYDSDTSARYPSVYMLHGGSGLDTEWVDYGLLDAAEKLMRSGAIAQMIVVLPQGDQEYWVDHVIDKATGANGEKWGTYTAREVVPTIDARYRTIAEPQERAIGGLSMGGHGAIQLALNFPGIWTVVGAHSPSIRPYGDAPTYLGSGVEFAARDPLALIASKSALARTYTWWIDTGNLDPWLAAATSVHAELTALDIPNEWKVFPGDHSMAYWSAHVDDYLRFYAAALCPEADACRASE